MIALTQESREAIQQRQERERMARIGAERRFTAEQNKIENRKSRNRAMLSLVVMLITGAWAYDAVSDIKHEGAQESQILEKSELTQAQINALHIIGTPSEKRGSK